MWESSLRKLCLITMVAWGGTVLAQTPVIGAAKQATADGRQITIDITLENLGTDDLSSVSVIEDLDTAFGAMNYSFVSAPLVTSGTAVINPGFDGSADPELLDASSTLAIGQTATIQLVVQLADLLDVGNGTGLYENQVTASATGDVSAGMTSDLSDDGTDPDPNGNDDPTDAGEDDATSIDLRIAVIGAAKESTIGGRGLTFLIRLENLGAEDLTGVSVLEDLDAVLGMGNYSVTSGPLVAGGSLVPNAGFDGSSDTELIGGGTLPYNTSATIEVGVELNSIADVGNGPGVYYNQVTASAVGSASATMRRLYSALKRRRSAFGCTSGLGLDDVDMLPFPVLRPYILY